MANGTDDPRVYQALALPEQALGNGGQEIMRLGVIDDELYVSALPAFKALAQWGEVLAEVTRRLGAIYAAQDTGLTTEDATVEIAEAFAAEFGAVAVKPAKASAKPKSPAKRSTKKPVKKAARKKR